MKIVCRHLDLDDDLSAVSRLIYQADSYIYRDLFGSEDEAAVVIPFLLKKNEGTYSHKYTHVIERDSEIVGTAALYNVLLKSKFDEIKEEVFARLETFPARFDAVSRHLQYSKNILTEGCRVSRFCIREDCRNLGMGSNLLQYLIDISKNRSMELTVLEGNDAAIRVYKKYYFDVMTEEFGYGIGSDGENVKRYVMVRKANKEGTIYSKI